MITLSNDQKRALDSILDWYSTYKKDRNASTYLTLGGYAGSGKTTLISVLRSELSKQNKDLKVAFCSYTGKATMVLKNRLEAFSAIYPKDTVSTIHSLIYSPQTNDNQEIVGWNVKEKLSCDLIIVDEASMVDRKIWQDLLSFSVPILAVGDHGQLPPINDSFNLMTNPLLKLEEIHRQAQGNPIIQLSLEARENGTLTPGVYDGRVQVLERRDTDAQEKINELTENFREDTLFLCGYNHTRIKLNQHIRANREFYSPIPEPGDRLICLRNNHVKQIFNGMLGTLKSITSNDLASGQMSAIDGEGPGQTYYVEVEMDGGVLYKGHILQEQFNSTSTLNFTPKRKRTVDVDLFDFGYALTVHKAQGSQARRVVLFAERFKQMDDEQWKRWLYTGITRAEEELFVFI